MVKRYHAILVLLAAAATLWGSPAWADDSLDGKALFEANCAVCHGKDASGSRYGNTLKPYPARNLRAISGLVDRDELRRIITYGVQGTSMTPKKYTLDPLDIEAVIDYIESLSYKPDLENGRKRFRAVCSACHGLDGRARTEIGARNLVYSRLDLKGIVHTMRYGRTGTAMTSKRHQLDNRDIADIAYYVRSLQYRPKAAHGARLYAEHCASCHADAARIPISSNIASRGRQLADLSDDALALRIGHGRHVARAGDQVTGLSGDEIRDIIAYMRKAGHGEGGGE